MSDAGGGAERRRRRASQVNAADHDRPDLDDLAGHLVDDVGVDLAHGAAEGLTGQLEDHPLPAGAARPAVVGPIAAGHPQAPISTWAKRTTVAPPSTSRIERFSSLA